MPVLTLPEAVDRVTDGATVYLGGAVLRRKPLALVRALVAAGRRDLDVVTFAGSLEVELLVAAGAARSVSSGYVGLGQAGFAPRFTEAVKAGAIEDREHTEWTLLGRLRAAAMGLPFLPTRAGGGSDIVEALGYEHVTDPYGTGTYLAVPPLRPDVTILHAWRATADGAVQMPWPPEHLWDVDVLAARAAQTVIVSVEEIIDFEIAAAEPERTRLHSFEVDVLVEAPGGAWPTASPPALDEDHHAVAAYAASGGDVTLLEPAG
jgi:glutaconate CoA-transferase, subunit A